MQRTFLKAGDPPVDSKENVTSGQNETSRYYHDQSVLEDKHVRNKLDIQSQLESKRHSSKKNLSADRTDFDMPRAIYYHNSGGQNAESSSGKRQPIVSTTNSAQFQRGKGNLVRRGLHVSPDRNELGGSLHKTALDIHERNDEQPTMNSLQNNNKRTLKEYESTSPFSFQKTTMSSEELSNRSSETIYRRKYSGNKDQNDQHGMLSGSGQSNRRNERKTVEKFKSCLVPDTDAQSFYQSHTENNIEYIDGCRPKKQSMIHPAKSGSTPSKDTKMGNKESNIYQSTTRDERHDDKLSITGTSNHEPVGYGFPFLKAMENNDASHIVMELTKKDIALRKCIVRTKLDPELLLLFLKVLNKAFESVDVPTALYTLFEILCEEGFWEALLTFLIDLQSSSDSDKKHPVVTCVTEIMTNQVAKNPMSITVFRRLFTIIKMIADDPANASGISDLTRESLNDFADLNNAYRKDEKPFEHSHEGKPPDDFRTIPVLPRIEEIKGFIQPFLRKNKLSGQYEDVDDYLDVQFRLLREDFIGPLRDGITEYIKHNENKTKPNVRNTDVRLYRNVFVVGPELTEFGLSFKMKMEMTPGLRKIHWELGKRLIYGSLVCLSVDEFDTLVLATVVDNKKIKDGIFTVFIEDENVKISEVLNRNFIVAESTVYFESYKHVLSGLQSINETNFSFAKHIVYSQPKSSPPAYLDHQTSFDLWPLIHDDYTIVHPSHIRNEMQRYHKRIVSQENKKSARVKVLDKSSWPAKESLQLDGSQLQAIQNALSREFAIIQGPPGTGKTYIGLKLAKILLHNKDTWGNDRGMASPMLIVCYTNHALDQFLEGVAQFYRGDLVRVGGRSTNERLKNYQLKQYRMGAYSPRSAIGKMKQLKDSARKDFDDSKTKIRELTITIQICLQTIINEETLRDVLSDGQFQSLQTNTISTNTDDSAQSTIAHWLRTDLIEHECRLAIYEGPNEDEDLENSIHVTTGNERSASILFEDILPEFDTSEVTILYQARRKILSGYNVTKEHVHEILNHITKIRFNLNEIDLNIKEVKSNEELSKKEQKNKIKELRRAQKRLKQEENELQFRLKKEQLLRKSVKNKIPNLILSHDLMTHQEVCDIDDIWKLNLKDRWRLYRSWVQTYCLYLYHKIEQEKEGFKITAKRYKEAQMLEDREILRHSSVIGMTTTCAARYLSTLRDIKPPIVIVEEAAEVLEAHIITTLSDGCKHLILIGDHKQLRPNPSVYKLAIRYNLNISLFERMVNNGVPRDCLELQHRMRPDIADIMRHIYPGLQDHNHVRFYGDVKGLAKNVMFINHNEPEISNGEFKSYANPFEADYVAKLAKHLLLQDYNGSQITVLTTYTGQLLELQRRMNRDEYADVYVTVVDNYQGEENDIVILSLVRSNHENRIGFLKTENRICVALSRARMGFFVVGNFDQLSSVSSLWKAITDDMMKRGSISSGLQLRCANHPNDPPKIAKTAMDFHDAPLGGCTKMCEARLNCGHTCPLKCHIKDPSHKLLKCQKPCYRLCERSHQCTGKCYQDPCPPCAVIVTMTIPQCKHLQDIECHLDPSKVICNTKPCPTILDCGHPCTHACGYSHTENCEYEIEKKFFCGHTCKIRCFQKNLEQCPQPCGSILQCGHECVGTCGSCLKGRYHDRCRQKCSRILICGHQCESPCAHCLPCDQKCQNKCVHNTCNKLCGIPCTPCKEPCTWSCKHDQCSKLCSEPCNRPPCNKPCERILNCNHICIGLCGEPCPHLCRICDKEKVTEIFFGYEDLQNARFVKLDDCGHVLESTGLDYYMNMKDETGELCFKCCPKCKTPIRKCVRYGNIVNKQLRDIEQVKIATLGGSFGKLKTMLDAETKFLLKQKNPISKSSYASISATELALKSCNAAIRNAYFKIQKRITSLKENKSCVILSDQVIQTINVQLQVIHKFETLFVMTVNTQRMSFFDDIVKKVAEARFVFSEQELMDINTELNRAQLYFKCYKLEKHLKRVGKHSRVVNDIKFVRNKLFSFHVLTADEFVQVRACLDRMKDMTMIPGLKITEEERISITQAMKLNKGHWFKCPNGHVYAIDDCGGANQRSKCPECKADIGGENHRLAEGNQLASEMDGATFAAYSEEANNLGNFNLDDLH
ncbi:NFX1-type zinc finger-containing protein 1-like [Dreissena polymorpha]|uniref:RZ-type domain-containing protein n=1 Tax=Dreissena polymorpha TaxID=45954 RepID=A0A9D4JI06_DREPO|nr:NFX1-type zinc finger-containing protein 1-like [Dreissena polymorpha]KAH3813306.1 hypothetical protein DPMN_141761 [Dreissena polymorpha]